MKRIIYLLSLVLFAVNAAWADDISVEQALQIARQFSAIPTQSGTARAKSAKATTVEPSLAHAVKSRTTKKDNVYVINLGQDQGFVIVSGEDGADDEILGYCDHGSFDYDKAPVQLKDMLTVYADGVDSLRMYGAPTKRAAVAAKVPGYKIGNIKVAPLLTTTWNQWEPYNQLCPAGCPTGCVPTAVAQIMYYWKHPETSLGRYKGTGTKFPKHTYDWDNMLDKYEDGKYTPEQALAVAQLMADIGDACHTAYSPSGSGTTFNVQWPMAENFAYSEDQEGWVAGKVESLLDLIRKELDEHRPVMYSAYPENGGDGHALVIDGYTAKNYFHFNYGWGGNSDGYYKNAVCYKYSKSPNIIIGIRPDKNSYSEMVADDLLYRLCDDGTAEVTGCMKSGKDYDELIIPACVTDSEGKEYRVVRVGERFLADNLYPHIKRLEIGDNIQYIAPSTFSTCTIDQLVFRDGVEEISPETFQGTRIGELVLGTGMKRIGYQAFAVSGIDKVTCKSPALVVDHGAFYGAHLPEGDWYGVITELGNSAFARAEFPKRPIFTNLEKIGASCFDRAYPFFGEFRLSAKIKYVHPQAFYGTQMTSLRMDEGNPYYFMDKANYLFDHDKTSLVMIFNYVGQDVSERLIPETVVKFEPGSIPTLKGPMSRYSITIPKGVEDVTGAFSQCEDMVGITCLAVTPPAANNATFSDALFKNNPELTLSVPAGTEELYENAPGWRRFPRIVGNQPYVPAPASLDREYYMVVHGSGADGKTLSRRIPVSKVLDIRIGDYVAQQGQTFVIAAEGEKNTFRVDSITWMKDFAFGTAEVFDLDPDHLEAKANDCTVRLSPCVIDQPVQLSIRKSLLSTGIMEGATRELALDISLSTGEHELSGIAEIEVPVTMSENETLMAAYFNDETGEWEPVLCLYNEKAQTARVITNHFSLFEFFFIVKDKDTRKQTLTAVEYITEASLKYYTPYQSFTTAAQTLLNITNSSDPDAEAVNAWKEDVGFWQTVGLDGGYNLLKGIGIVNKSVDNAVGVVGKLGTAMAILDVALADIKGDDAALATNTAKAINSVIGMHLSAIFDASILSFTSGLTAFVGIALEKLGTKVQTAKLDYTRAMYRYYYSEEGHSDCSIHSRFGSKYWRTEKDWFKLLYPYIEKNSDNDKFVAYVEGMVHRYCEQFWDEGSDLQYVCESEAKRLGFSSSLFISESDKQKVCDEYFAELIDGPITRVMMDIRRKLAKKTKDRYDARVKEYVNFMNTPVGFRFRDSSCAEGETSRFSGYKVRFTDTPADVTDGERWECAINDKGTGTLGLFSLFALVDNKIRPQLTLVDTFGDEVATFDYELSKEGRRIILDFDLAKQGTPALSGKNLELTYSTDTLVVSTNIDFYYTLFGETKIVEMPQGMECIFFDFYNLPHFGINVRFQSEVEKFLLAHDSISVEYGKVRMGDDIIGDWDEASQEGSGKFTINTTYPFVICTKDEYIASWNAWEGYIRPGYAYPRLDVILNGSLKHQIDCQFSIKRLKDQSAFEITCTGEGDYRMDAEQVTALTGLDGDSVAVTDERGATGYDWNFCMLKPENVITGPLTDEGTVKLNYTKKIQIK